MGEKKDSPVFQFQFDGLSLVIHNGEIAFSSFFAYRRMSKHGIDHLPISTKFDVVPTNEDLSEDSVVA